MVDVVCVEQPQASWEERSMKHYAGLDVSVKETSLCIVDEAGRICREMKVVSHPKDLLAVLCDPAWRLERVGLEAGPLSQWLFSGFSARRAAWRAIARKARMHCAGPYPARTHPSLSAPAGNGGHLIRTALVSC